MNGKITALSCAVLSLTLLRCSPIALSTSKLRAIPVSSNGTSDPAANQPSGPGHQGSSLTAVPASVHEIQAYHAAIAALAPEQHLTFAADTEAFAELASARALTLHLPGRAPEHLKIYLGLSLSEASIGQNGWDGTSDPLTTDFTPSPGGIWKVTVSASVSAQTWALVVAKLESVTIYASTNAAFELVGDAPAPEPRVRLTPTP